MILPYGNIILKIDIYQSVSVEKVLLCWALNIPWSVADRLEGVADGDGLSYYNALLYGFGWYALEWNARLERLYLSWLDEYCVLKGAWLVNGQFIRTI